MENEVSGDMTKEFLLLLFNKIVMMMIHELHQEIIRKLTFSAPQKRVEWNTPGDIKRPEMSVATQFSY